jgi:hypothetical protein
MVTGRCSTPSGRGRRCGAVLSVHEKVLAAAIAHDEAKPLGRVVPLHRAVLLDRGSVSRLICSSLRALMLGLFLRRRAGVHAEDLRHLRSLRSGAGAHLKRRTGEHTAAAIALDHAHMQESVARAVGKFDEAKSFVRVVPLDDGSDGLARGCFKTWDARPRRKSEVVGWRLLVVVVETTAADRLLLRTGGTCLRLVFPQAGADVGWKVHFPSRLAITRSRFLYFHGRLQRPDL